MFDPRNDLPEDRLLWTLILACAATYQNKLIFGNLHGLRCGGARLSVNNGTLKFSLPQELNSEITSELKQKYIMPYAKQIKELFKFTLQYYQQNVDELIMNNKTEYLI